MSAVATNGSPLLEVQDLQKEYVVGHVGLARRPQVMRAVDGVSFRLAHGETLALVGESGSGKTTTGKAIVHLAPPTAGSVRLEGEELSILSSSELRQRRRAMQFIFQDPFASLNPRMRVTDILAEPMRNFPGPGYADGRARVQRTRWLLDRVGLRPASVSKFPHEFSGGQRQRLGIARALALNPKLIVCDEPVSALDVSVQAQVINLLMDLQREFGLSYLFIAHDLAVVRHISHRIAVMYLGKIVEIADRDALFEHPAHPYTQVLMESVPAEHPGLRRPKATLRGEPPNPARPPSGCRFHTRCPHATAVCREVAPVLKPAAASQHRFPSNAHWVACHLQ